MIADDYAGHIVLEISTLAALRAKPVLMEALTTECSPKSIVLRADEERLKHEFGGSVPHSTSDALTTDAPSEPVVIEENDLRFW